MRRLPTILAYTATALAPVLLPEPRASADQAASPKQECLAASEQGQNQRDEGQYRAARQAFLTCARDVCPRLVAVLCTKWLRDLDESAPTIVPGAKDEQGGDLTDVLVTFDGAPFAKQLDGVPLEVDVGEHILRFEREGSDPVEQKVTVRTGERARVVTVTLRSIRPPNIGALPSSNLEESTSGAREPILSPHHVAATSMGLAALAAVGTGAYFLVQSNHNGDDAANLRRDMASNACSHGTSTACQSLSDKVHSQHDDMAVATALFIGGGMLAAGAVATWLLWPAHRDGRAQPSVWLAPTRNGLALVVARSFE
jgi:hypothetical protein